MTPLQVHILELLAADALYCRALVKRSGRLKSGTVYKMLSRMEDKGYVVSAMTRTGIPKRLYKLTELGYRTLKGYRAMEAAING